MKLQFDTSVRLAEVTLPVDLPALLREIETTHIRKALEQTNGNKKAAAKLLGMGRTTLVEKLKRHPLDPSSMEDVEGLS